MEVRAFAPIRWSPWTTTVAISQWPSTTMSRLPARTASMNRSRSGAVAVATLSAKVAGGGRTGMSSFWPPGGPDLPVFSHPQQGQDLCHHQQLRRPFAASRRYGDGELGVATHDLGGPDCAVQLSAIGEVGVEHGPQ